MKVKNNKKNIKILITIFMIIVLAIIIVNIQLNKTKTIDAEKSFVLAQKEIEAKIDSKGYRIENPNVILNPYKISPLTALITFETETEVSPKVIIKGKDKLSTFEHEFEKSKNHYLSIYGLYPDSENEIEIQVGEVKKTVKIKTDALPEKFVLPTKVTADKKELTNDLYFFTPAAIGYTCAYDVNGDVRWYLTTNNIWEIKRLENGNLMLSSDKLINPPYYLSGLVEMDLLGKIYQEYTIPGGYHHDYFEMPNGNLLVASNDFTSGTVEDYIVEIDRLTGNIVKRINLKNILPVNEGKSENWTDYDWFHNNSVWYDNKTNSIILSGRHQDIVVNVDYETLKINYIIGDPAGWGEEMQKYFLKPINKVEWEYSQHAAKFLPNGYISIFDNGNNRSKDEDKYVSADKNYSRGVIYNVNQNNMTISQVWEYGKSLGSSFYSPYISDFDYLSDNHYLVHSGGISYKDGKILNVPAGLGGADKMISRTVEIKNDKVIFEIELPTNNYRSQKMSLYSKNTYSKEVGKKLGSAGKTPIDNEKYGIILNAKKQDEAYEEHNVKITKESDRLVVSGTFKQGTKVEILLGNNFKIKSYELKVSKTPYTAMCVDMFTEAEQENGITVNKYINDEGLKGNYDIFIKINDKIYKTSKNIIFKR